MGASDQSDRDLPTFEAVVAGERKDIDERRRRQGLVADLFRASIDGLDGKTSALAEAVERTRPSGSTWGDRGNLVGLALSGGGIRSATFNLGVLQALQKNQIVDSGGVKRSLFDHVDYLSTVSGGGYIGAALSTSLSARGGGRFPFAHKMGEQEGAIFKHLRDHSNYLAPRGPIDLIQAPLLVFRGMLSNFVVLMAAILWCVVVTPWVYTWYRSGLCGLPDILLLGDCYFVLYPLTLLTAVTIAIGLLAYPVVHRRQVRRHGKTGGDSWEFRQRWAAFAGAATAVLAVVAFIETQHMGLQFMAWMRQLRDDGALDRFWDFDTWTVILGTASTILPTIPGVFGRVKSGFGASRWQKIGIIAVSALGFLVFWLVYLGLAYRSTGPAMTDFNYYLPWRDGIEAWWMSAASRWWIAMCALALVATIYVVRYVDVNLTSLHNLYRDRLSRAYVVHEPPPPAGGTVHDDRICLSQLSAGAGPYHLLNAALNVPASSSFNQRGRNAQFLFFGRRYVGSDATGYCTTEAMESADPHVNLATAMAISGAVAAPAMGGNTSRPLAFLLAMFNVRLGYWLPNPGAVAKARALTRKVGFVYLVREALSLVNERSSYVHLTDGGHIENLGIYELLRRECRLIVCGDAEHDPNYAFGGLMTLIRFARIDLGIKVDFSVADLDAVKAGDRHYAVGTIHYSGGRAGALLYLKSSLGRPEQDTKIEPFVHAYRASGKTDDTKNFPHESTADQFFDEEQFECYRALGFRVAESAL